MRAQEITPMDTTASNAPQADAASRTASGRIGAMPLMNSLAETRYRVAQTVRTAWYLAHYAAIRGRAGGFTRPGEPEFVPSRGRPDRATLRRAFMGLFETDLANIRNGLYPAPRDLDPRALPGTLARSRDLLRDAREVDRRRKARSGTEVRELPDAERFPVYYRQNFHYQSDGWFSADSAARYDTQVEVLFTGAADAMRRMALAVIAQEMKGRDQRMVSLLDLAGGNGRFLESVMGAFPRLQASLLDLSPAYTAAARKRLASWRQVEVIEGAAEAMPLPDASQDIVVSVYLFHELPPKIRPLVFAEIARVLKPGGLFVFADALQYGDTPALDGLLETFPEGFHEPYFRSYLEEDFARLAAAVGLQTEIGPQAHFLTRVTGYRRTP
jgi:ubiquinone/menaquinone biosynthesis C-methylase UbiE